MQEPAELGHDGEADAMPKACAACGKMSQQPSLPCTCRWPVWAASMRLWQQELPFNFDELLQKPCADTRQIELDISRTFPQLEGFDSRRQASLRRVLEAYSNLQPDVGYCQGMNFVAGWFVLVFDREEDAFRAFACLMNDYGLADFYRKSFPLMRRFVLAIDYVLRLEAPQLHSHLSSEGVEPYLYLYEWLLSLFVDCMPLGLVLEIFDAITERGLFIVVPVVVSILLKLEGKLLTLRFDDIFHYLKAMRDLDLHDGDMYAKRLKDVVSSACAFETSPEVLDYLRGDTDELADVEVPVEIEKGARGWLQAISRSISSLSPKRRRGQRSSVSVSPKKLSGGASACSSSPLRPHALLDDCSSLAWPTPEREPPCHIIEAASPSKWRGLRNIASRTSPSKNGSDRHEQGLPPVKQMFEGEQTRQTQQNAGSRKSSRVRCCSSQGATSPVRRRSTCSSIQSGCSSSPIKSHSCSNSPVRRRGSFASPQHC